MRNKRKNTYNQKFNSSVVGMLIIFSKKTSIASNVYFHFDEKIYQPEEVSEVPYPYLGYSHLARLIEKNTIYPEYPHANTFEGTVWVKFTINPMGFVINTRIYKGVQNVEDQTLANLINGRAIYAINTTYQHWHPGILNGKRVKAEMILPVEFILK